MTGVAVFLGNGVAQVAGRSYGIVPGPEGAVALAGGPLLRPLRFGERARLARAAQAASAPEEELIKSVLAMSGDSGPDHPAAAALALHLAGAGAGADVGFATAQSILARQLGWSATDVAAAEAAEVDVLASQWHRTLQTERDGWTKMVFAAPETDAGDDPQAIAHGLAQDLLRRASAALDPDELPVATAPVTASAPPASVDVSSWGNPALSEDVPDTRRAAGSDQPDLGVANSTSAIASPACVPRDANQSASPVADADQGISAPRTEAAFFATRRSSEAPAAPVPVPMSGPPEVAVTASRTADSTAPMPVSTHVDQAAQLAARQNIWAPRPLLADRVEMPVPRATLDDEGLGPAAFSDWFEAPQQAISAARTGPQTPAPWVWDAAPTRQIPEPVLPEATSAHADETAIDALADALHLAADLRGIAS